MALLPSSIGPGRPPPPICPACGRVVGALTWWPSLAHPLQIDAVVSCHGQKLVLTVTHMQQIQDEVDKAWQQPEE